MSAGALGDKLPVLLAYGTILATIACVPNGQAQISLCNASRRQVRLWGLLACALSAYFFILGANKTSLQYIALICGLACTTFLQRGNRSLMTLAAAFITSCIAASLLWWVDVDTMAWRQVAMAVAIASGLMYVLNLEPSTRGLSCRSQLLLSTIATLLAFLFVEYGAFEVRSHTYMAWHHWGAYLGSVESAQAGLIPFVDIPLQYGIGPLLLIALAAGGNGFDGMHWVVLASTLVGVFVVVDTCLLLVAPARSRLLSLIAAIAALTACALWVAAPPIVSSSMVTPSTFGLRFVPPLILVWVLLRFPRAQACPLATWMLCMAWSIECAFYASAIYWGSRLSSELQLRSREYFVRLARITAQALAACCAVIVLFCFVFWLFFRVVPDIRLFSLYAIHPPGPLPINWKGSVWWLVLLLALAIFALCARGVEKSQKRSVRICALAAAGFASYYLGRSHDNNIANLMPVSVLLVCALVGIKTDFAWLRSNARLLLVAPLALIPFFGFGAWGNFSSPGAGAWGKNMSFARHAPPDLRSAISYIQSRDEAFDVLESGAALNINGLGSASVWQALHPLSNYPDVPVDLRRAILRAGVRKLDKPGWIIANKSLVNDGLVADFIAEYRQTEGFEAGRYIAIRFEPRTSKP